MNILKNCKEKVKFAKKKVGKVANECKEAGAKFLKEEITNHPEVIGSIITGTIGAIAVIVRGSQGRTEEKCRIHDELTGFDWLTIHELTNQEKLEANGLMDNDGYSLGHALDACGYLKKEKKT